VCVDRALYKMSQCLEQILLTNLVAIFIHLLNSFILLQLAKLAPYPSVELDLSIMAYSFVIEKAHSICANLFSFDVLLLGLGSYLVYEVLSIKNHCNKL
jgi:hypothetical protein